MDKNNEIKVESGYVLEETNLSMAELEALVQQRNIENKQDK